MNNYPIFDQINQFTLEILQMVDQGKVLSIEEVCDHIEEGNIIDYIGTKCRYSCSFNKNNIVEINDLLKNKYVSEAEASHRGIKSNGLLFLLCLMSEDTVHLLYTMTNNNINPEDYRV